MNSNRNTSAVVLVGHGGVPRGYPRERLRRLMALERQREAAGAPMGEEERALDHEIRHFPRTAQNDPYRAGLLRVAAVLEPKLSMPLYVAYNEFCAPSVPDAVRAAVDDGATEIILMSSMMTPGGSHSERDIPELMGTLQVAYPRVAIRYAWPFDLEDLASFMAGHIQRFSTTAHRQVG